MRQFIIKIFVFMGILVVALLPLSLLFNRIASRNYMAAVQVLKQSRPIVLILGDSHPLAMKKEHLPPHVFNFSYGSDNLTDMYTKLQFFIDQYGAPEMVVLECDRHIFSTYRSVLNNNERSLFYMNFGVYREIYGFHPLKYFVRRHVFRWFPMANMKNLQFAKKAAISRVEKFVSHKEERAQPPWSTVSVEDRVGRVEQRLELQFSSPYDSVLVQRFFDIVTLCKDLNIRILGVRYPVTPEYDQALNKMDLQRIEQVFLDNEVDYLDFSASFSDPLLFQNEDHISEKGSLKLCRELDAHWSVIP
ncbi:hypothetical protein [Tichowtungia aerotolerans]|uniref:DUF1574 domain-containing protein n=1 Tax=Tichowtungia aerotolerans TaxID=2697043 RepID=A0A6P1MAQ4_9BACT|nr:hypothetical protein [Tichowtungia aerotolerans]QHI70183.1 hypothetical protein GT409_12280 [Tichowtungia aerotolerans]